MWTDRVHKNKPLLLWPWSCFPSVGRLAHRCCGTFGRLQSGRPGGAEEHRRLTFKILLINKTIHLPVFLLYNTEVGPCESSILIPNQIFFLVLTMWNRGESESQPVLIKSRVGPVQDWDQTQWEIPLRAPHHLIMSVCPGREQMLVGSSQ